MWNLNNRTENTEDRISNIEDNTIEILQREKRELRLKRNEETLREMSDSIRKYNIRITGIPEGEEKENGAESLFKEIIAEDLPNPGRELESHVKRPPDLLTLSL